MASEQLQITSLFDVKGLVAVVTGGGTGIGLMIATVLEHNGAKVYIVGRRLEVLQKAAAENNKYGKIIPLQGDVTSKESLLFVVDTIKNSDGYINVLINNSGVMYNNAGAPRSASEDISSLQSRLWNAGTPQDFVRTFDVNVAGVYYTSVAFLGLLDAGNKRSAATDAPTSQIITVSSIAGFRRDGGMRNISYAASKAATTHLGKILANVLKPYHIRSNVIAPGLYPSEMTASVIDPSKKVDANTVPLERYGTAEDMGGLVLFLTSRAGAYVSGGVHVTDGGRLGLFASSF